MSLGHVDSERPSEKEVPHGFAAVAVKLASDADKTTAIYRRFDRLSARNLLYLEAEIAELEAQQQRFDEQDLRNGDLTTKECHSDWVTFVGSAAAVDGGNNVLRPKEKERMELILRTRKLIKEYHKALVLHQTLLNSPSPAPATLKALRRWFLGGGEACGIPQLNGAIEYVYDDPSDLVALRVGPDQDRLSRIVLEYFGVFFVVQPPDGRSAYVSGQRIATFVSILSTILAAVLLFGAIISLYIVQNPKALLGMISAWTVIFSACVGFLTTARRTELFAATAAYAAVLVVFVSGNLGRAPPT